MGFISHLTFFCFFCAVVVWSGRAICQIQVGFKRALASMLACHALPLLVLGLLYYFDIRVMTMNHGTRSGLLKVYAEALAWTLGFPAGLPVLAIALLAAAMFGAGLWMLWRERSDLPVFFAGVMVFPILLRSW